MFLLLQENSYDLLGIDSLAGLRSLGKESDVVLDRQDDTNLITEILVNPVLITNIDQFP